MPVGDSRLTTSKERLTTGSDPASPHGEIILRGVNVHNLRDIDLNLPRQQLVVFCGVSGSGKTSLALDTLYAEGQRRYIESFSTYTRQFLERLEKPAAERIDGIPPAIAVTHKATTRSNRTTIGTATETTDYLRLLFAKIGQVICPGCGRHVQSHTPQSVANSLIALPTNTRYLITFPLIFTANQERQTVLSQLRADGFVRAIVKGHFVSLETPDTIANDQPLAESSQSHDDSVGLIIVDRLVAGSTGDERIRDSLETAFEKSDGQCTVLFADNSSTPNEPSQHSLGRLTLQIDEQNWTQANFSTELRCDDCQLAFPPLEPKLFSFNNPLGACPECEGFGNIVDIDMDLVVPDRNKTLRQGAIAPWNTPAYAHELTELVALAKDYEIPLDIPFGELGDESLRLIREGVPERKFGGLNGFFAWLERRKYKMHLRVFLSRWRCYRTCQACKGKRLRPESLQVQIGGKSIADISQLQIDKAQQFFSDLELPAWESEVGQMVLNQVRSRLHYLQSVGLGYLSLDRTLRTLSGGEAQRVALTSALGSNLVNMLYVLDEPSIGLHPQDVDRLLKTIEDLCKRGNSVVVVEHEEAVIQAADQLIEIGPGAGMRGGNIVFQGSPKDILHVKESLTGDYLSGRRGNTLPTQRREPCQGSLRLKGARGNNLKNIDVEFPLGLLCLVTGVSGAGKSTLVQETLYPALCRRLGKDTTKPLAHDDIFGDGQLEDVILVDQSPVGRSPRSNPVTYIKAFDSIRTVFAETLDARTHNYSASHFSFNVDGGRCSVCKGDGHQQIDMQFLADVFMKCSQCAGQRYRAEILEIRYRGRNIAEVLDMTVREAFGFFRGQIKVQSKLRQLMDVGLDYLRLGQPANTLSAGEAQRLKLASYIASASRKRTLFVLDEPTSGLHFSDIVNLLDCFEALLCMGHSLVVVEHNLQMMKAADHIIDLGPGAAEKGGQISAAGSPDWIIQQDSPTGRFLAKAFAISPLPPDECSANST